MSKVVVKGWTVIQRSTGKPVAFEFGDPFIRSVFHLDKGDARRAARLLAERLDELSGGDVNRWEFSTMPFSKVWRMVKLVPAKVVV